MKLIKNLYKNALYGIAGGLLFSLAWCWLFSFIGNLIVYHRVTADSFSNTFIFMNPLNPFGTSINIAKLSDTAFATLGWALFGLFFGSLIPWIFKNKHLGLSFSSLIAYLGTLVVYIPLQIWINWGLIEMSMQQNQMITNQPITPTPIFRWYVVFPFREITIAFVAIWLSAFLYYKLQTHRLNKRLN